MSVSAANDIYYDVVSGFNRYNNYEPVIFHPDLPCCSFYSQEHHVNFLGSQLNVPAWEYELGLENDVNLRNYIHFGVTNGFLIVDEGAKIPMYERSNYASAITGPAFDFVNDLVLKEVAAGILRITDVKPHCIHSIGAVLKKDGKSWRPIRDCSHPSGESINMYMSSTFKEFCYSSIDDVINMLEPGCWMSTIDISSAYRTILIHPSN